MQSRRANVNLAPTGSNTLGSTITSMISNSFNSPKSPACDPTEEILCASFSHLDEKYRNLIRILLLLGYQRGFQLWEVLECDVMERISIRNDMGRIVDIQVFLRSQSYCLLHSIHRILLSLSAH
jgi:hypothetical protein